MAAMMSKIWLTISGASPIEGSSIITSWGRAMSARAMASICCSPPERVPPCCLRRSESSGKRAKARSKSSASLLGERP